MKKILFSLLMLLCATVSYAQSFTSTQENLRKEISSFLSRKGLNPENQSDGLKFKSEGSNFYIEIDKEKKNPMYVRLRRYIKFDESITREKAIKSLNGYNVKYGVKVSCQPREIVVSSEMFLTKIEEFTYVFDDLLTQVKRASSLVTE